MSSSHPSSLVPSGPHPAPEDSDILARLREQTSAQHAAIERALDLLNSAMTPGTGLELELREKTALLCCDLRSLGRDPVSLVLRHANFGSSTHG
jgi:hypothetical protein